MQPKHAVLLFVLLCVPTWPVDVTIPTTSFVSPLNLTISAATAPIVGPWAPRSLGNGKWSVDIELDPAAPRVVSVVDAVGSVNGAVAWSVINLASAPMTELDIRVGDSVRLLAPEGANISGPGSTMIRLSPSVETTVTCREPGIYQARVADVPVFTIHAIGLPYAPAALAGRSLYSQIGKTVAFRLPADPGLAKVHIGTAAKTVDLTVTRVSQQDITLKVGTIKPVILTVRLGGPAGPLVVAIPVQGYSFQILGERPAHPLTLTEGTLTTFMKSSTTARTLPPEEIIVDVRLKPWLPEARILAVRFAHSATFLGGVSTFTLATDGGPTSLGEPGMVLRQVNGLTVGEFSYSVFKPHHERSTCVRVQLLQILPLFEPITPSLVN